MRGGDEGEGGAFNKSYGVIMMGGMEEYATAGCMSISVFHWGG